MEKKIYSREFITDYVSTCSDSEFEFFCSTMKVIECARALKNALTEKMFCEHDIYFKKDIKNC